METQNQEIINEVQEIIKTDKSTYVPKRESSRFNKETGKYNHHPLDPDYFNKYYHARNEQIPCEHCGQIVGKLRMCKHVKSKKCMKKQLGDEYDTLMQIEDLVFKLVEIRKKNI